MIIDTNKLILKIEDNFQNSPMGIDECDVNLIKIMEQLDQIVKTEVGQRILVDIIENLYLKNVEGKNEPYAGISVLTD